MIYVSSCAMHVDWFCTDPLSGWDSALIEMVGRSLSEGGGVLGRIDVVTPLVLTDRANRVLGQSHHILAVCLLQDYDWMLIFETCGRKR